ncbi:MAG: hypothetical protein QOG04_1819 [Actinomycetota bacterium]|jgi:hypothetical protein|nr:hypothetical protein [Actinomycetota bacterium]
MNVVRWIGFAFGILVVLWTGSSVVRTLIVPRGLQSSLPRAVARYSGRFFHFIARRFDTYEDRDKVLAFQAPSFLLFLLSAWIVCFVVGYALLLWPFITSFSSALLESGSSVFTLGFAGTHEFGPTLVHFAAAATGLVVVALLVGYLPTLYAAFNRRETMVTMLQSRAGAPAWGPEILLRYQNVGLVEQLPGLYNEWERWAADVSESHTNYPVLIFFRSPHPLRSWVLGLLAVMDSAALYLSLSPTAAPTEARLCLRMGFLCLRDIANFLQIEFDPDPMPEDPISLTFEEFAAGIEGAVKVGFELERTLEEAWPHFRGWRVNYEAVAYSIANVVSAPPGPWSGPRDNLPGMEIIPQRPANRSPDNSATDQRPKGTGSGH